MFFSVTKLFQHKDVHLRRMVYLIIKVLSSAQWEWGQGLPSTARVVAGEGRGAQGMVGLWRQRAPWRKRMECSGLVGQTVLAGCPHQPAWPHRRPTSAAGDHPQQ